MRFQVLTAAIMKTTAFWDIPPCSPLEETGDGGSTQLWNVGLLQRDYTALYPKKLSSSKVEQSALFPQTSILQRRKLQMSKINKKYSSWSLGAQTMLICTRRTCLRPLASWHCSTVFNDVNQSLRLERVSISVFPDAPIHFYLKSHKTTFFFIKILH
jgi:hypothetical protein